MDSYGAAVTSCQALAKPASWLLTVWHLCAFTYFIVSFIFCSFCFYVWFSVRTGEVTGRLIKSFQWILCLFAQFVYQTIKQTVSAVCATGWVVAFWRILVVAEENWINSVSAARCLILFLLIWSRALCGTVFCLVCFLKSLFLWISDHYNPLPLSVCVQSCPHPQIYWYS